MSKGIFISIEGCDGTGKSTQVRNLAAYLSSKEIDVVQTREPGGSFGAEEIRAMLVSGDTSRWHPMTESLMHLAARNDHTLRTIRPALSRDSWVISDRFNDSTIAYQGYGHGVELKHLETISNLVLAGFTPDLTFVLDMPSAASLERARDRSTAEDRYEKMDGDFHERVRKGFLAIAAEHKDRCIVVDAERSAGEISDTLCSIVEERFLT